MLCSSDTVTVQQQHNQSYNNTIKKNPREICLYCGEQILTTPSQFASEITNCDPNILYPSFQASVLIIGSCRALNDASATQQFRIKHVTDYNKSTSSTVETKSLGGYMFRDFQVYIGIKKGPKIIIFIKMVVQLSKSDTIM